MTTDTQRRKMPKAYDPSSVEARLYAAWEEGGYFQPSGEGEPFCIIMELADDSLYSYLRKLDNPLPWSLRLARYIPSP